MPIGLFLAFILLCAGPWLARSAPVTILLQPQAVVPSSQVTIGDVAVVEGDDAALVTTVREIVIGQAPPLGQKRDIPGSYVLTRLKQHGLRPDMFEVQPVVKIAVSRAAQRLGANEIEAAVSRALVAQMPWEPRRVSLREVRGLEPISVPPGPVTYEVSFAPHSDFLGLTSFTVVVRVAEETAARLFGTTYIEVTQDVVTATRPIARHEVIGARDVRLTAVPLEPRAQQVFTNLADVVGKRARRPLQAQLPIRPTEIEAAPLVQKGDMVLILAESSLLKVTAMGEALEQGFRGETIRIKNKTSERELRAVVVDAKTVKVLF